MARRGEPLRVLFILFEGLPTTVIDSQVLQHVRAMKERSGAYFEIWAFACSDDLYAASLKRRDYAEDLAGCPVRVFRGLRPAVPGSCLWNGIRIARELSRQPARFDLIHARTDYSAACAARAARRFGLPLLWDCRGDSVAEFIERYRPRSLLGRMLGRWKARQLRAERREAGHACAGALFVSEALSELCAEDLGSKRFWVVPCVASERHFFFDPALRKESRAAMGYSEAERVFVYTGSLAAYQSFGETVALFAEIHRRNENARLLILTPAVEAAWARMRAVPPGVATVMSVPLEAVNGYLNAADAAFLLRADTNVNRVASPTKLAEYCVSGLPVVMTDAVLDAAQMTALFGNRLAPDPEVLSRTFAVDRAEVARRAAQMLTRAAVGARFEEAYAALSRHGHGSVGEMSEEITADARY